MDGAVWGAVGAMVGAGLTALGGYLGPVRAARAAARQQAQQRREEREAGAVERLIAIRSAYRAWDLYLNEAASSHRGPAKAVARRISELREAALEASDAAMRDGWWIGTEHIAFESVSAKVLAFVSGATPAVPSAELAEVRRMRNGLNERILERLTALLENVTVLRNSPDQ
ncbi:hypothetical protein [Streptomyces sp. N2A]|uniref:hypothetical protein n=1 Tax=Streptomyces sp. N2A TaxID=3073936 RepID=UPI002870786C|nr:hypothetical protein [Streptomyces sp. N2A]